MITKTFKEVVFELIKELTSLESISRIVLFGSVARGEADQRSDLDFLVVLKNQNEKKKINQIINEISKKHDKTIQTVFTNKDFTGLDNNFMENLAKEGIVLYGKSFEVKADKLSLEPYVLINYDTIRCSLQERNKLNRILYGYNTKKVYKGKKYTSGSKGLLEKYGGWKFGLATVIVPFAKTKVFNEIFNSNKVKQKKVEMWIAKI